MIIVCEPVCYGHEHVPFNAALLETICSAYPHERVAFYGEESHLQQVRVQIGQSLSASIFWTPIVLPPRHAEFFSRLGRDFKLVAHLINATDRNNGGLLVFTCVTPSTIFVLNFLLKFVYRQAKVQAVLHGILGSLTGWRSRNPFIRFTDLRSALSLGSCDRIQYIILEESIKRKLLCVISFLQGSVAVLEHPIAPNERFENSIALMPPIKFGFLGASTEAKGFDRYLKVASEIKSRFPGRAEFHAYGSISDGLSKLQMSVLDVQPQQTKLGRNQYVCGLKNLHFVCFPYKKGHYELSPSGALLDAVAFGKPIVASRLPIFEALFDRYGDIGYLFDTEGEFCQIIQQIAQEADDRRYANQVINIKRLRDDRSSRFLAIKYRNITSGLIKSAQISTALPRG
ncbi:MAG: glycosyltransferase [Thermodesulfobacteriota bacterium]|nr:glycosyltransferase [Thermodesulfobacteriota bacterium]